MELGILGRQCLDRRIETSDELHREVAAWKIARDASGVKTHWQFTTEDARIKLRKPDPSLE